MIAAIYSRKSTESEKKALSGKSDSVDLQIANARAYAAKHGWAVPAEHVYLDDGVSGATWAKLKGRGDMLKAAERGDFEVLVVSEQSRLGRHMIESSYTIMQLADMGVRMYSYLDDQESGSRPRWSRPTSS